jgi:hypothetical protein
MVERCADETLPSALRETSSATALALFSLIESRWASVTLVPQGTKGPLLLEAPL